MENPDTLLFNPNYWDGLQALGTGADNHDNSLADAPDVMRSQAVHVQPFTATPRLPNGGIPENYCGQAAAAVLIKAHGKHKGQSDQALIQDLYQRFPPNVLGGAAGTGPFQIVAMLKAYGLDAGNVWVPHWQPGGFLNPANQPVWHSYRLSIESWVRKGFPVICLVDAGKLYGGKYNFVLHWVVYHQDDDQNVRLCNALGPQGYADLPAPKWLFHQAWENWFASAVPLVRFACVVGRPV